jgi:hypothetical protein
MGVWFLWSNSSSFDYWEDYPMTADIMTIINRIDKQFALFQEMMKTSDDKRFWEIAREFDHMRELDRLEDELNARGK